jgi:cysteine rich repeat protein
MLKSKSTVVAAILFTVALSGSALAQAADSRGACKADYDKFCAGTAPGGGRVVACLNKQRDQLSDTCKKALDSRKK